MPKRTFVLGLVLAAAVVAAVPAPGVSVGFPVHYASGSGVLPGGLVLSINASAVTGVGGLGVAQATAGTGSVKILLTCLEIGSPATGLSTGHFLGASGTGQDAATYYIAITDSAATGVPDTAGIATSAGTGPCGAPPAAAVPGDPYLILL